MTSLAVLIFVVVLLTQLVAWVGKSVLQQAAFALYSQVVLAGTRKKQSKLRKQVLEDKAELGRTSSQDQFAKWAKIKRRVDKGLAELEGINSQLSSAQTGFGLKFSSFIWIITTGAQLVLVWWYRKQPVFWLPKGWTPGPVTWILSLPSAPKGSVSSGAWCAVCKRVLVSLEEIVKELATPTPVAQAVPVPAAAEPTSRFEEIPHDKLD